MKFLKFLVLSSMILECSGCNGQTNINDKQPISMLKEFYTTYINVSLRVEDLHKVDSLQQKYCTPQLKKEAKGYLQNVNGWDATDAGVGILGLGATGAVYLGLISNPIGWGIGAGVLIYSGSRLAYDLYNKP